MRFRPMVRRLRYGRALLCVALGMACCAKPHRWQADFKPTQVVYASVGQDGVGLSEFVFTSDANACAKLAAGQQHFTAPAVRVFVPQAYTLGPRAGAYAIGIDGAAFKAALAAPLGNTGGFAVADVANAGVRLGASEPTGNISVRSAEDGQVAGARGVTLSYHAFVGDAHDESVNVDAELVATYCSPLERQARVRLGAYGVK